MNFYSHKNHLTELSAEWKNFRDGAYPDFVRTGFSGKAPDEIPVFSLHNIMPETLEPMLLYLKKNGYETLVADEYLKRCGKMKNERQVMLTFDDGHASLWTVAYPLLKKYGMKAVVFVLPGETKDAVAPRKTFDGAYGEIDNDDPLCSWSELSAMGDTIDVQSHSLYHWIIFVSKKVACFFNPDIKKGWAQIDLPIVNENGEDDLGRGYPFGTPFYDMGSRLSDGFRMFEPSALRKVCARHVEENGGKGFFERKDWLLELLKVHNVAALDETFSVETKEERETSILKCFTESKKILEDRLCKKVNHFCFPFGIGGRFAQECAIEAGFTAVYYGVKAPGGVGEKDALVVVTRIKDDYVYRLPGNGRLSLASIFASKFIRRFKSAIFKDGSVR